VEAKPTRTARSRAKPARKTALQRAAKAGSSSGAASGRRRWPTWLRISRRFWLNNAGQRGSLD